MFEFAMSTDNEAPITFPATKEIFLVCQTVKWTDGHGEFNDYVHTIFKTTGAAQSWINDNLGRWTEIWERNSDINGNSVFQLIRMEVERYAKVPF
jgi:hypothetical protein